MKINTKTGAKIVELFECPKCKKVYIEPESSFCLVCIPVVKLLEVRDE